VGQALGAKNWKSAVLALLAANTAVVMKQADGYLSLKETDPYYSSFPDRINTTITGEQSFWFLLASFSSLVGSYNIFLQRLMSKYMLETLFHTKGWAYRLLSVIVTSI
jgi:hypothetical protein